MGVADETGQIVTGWASQPGATAGAAPGRAPHAGPVAPTVNPYLAQFNASLDSSYANVGRQQEQYLHSLRASSDASARVLATLPQENAQNYGGALASLAAGEHTGAGALSADVNRGFTKQINSPLRAAIQANQAVSAGSSPFLEQARLQQQSAGENQINTATISARADIDAQRRDLAMKQWEAGRQDAQIAAQAQGAKDNALQQHRWDMDVLNTKRSQDLTDQQNLIAQKSGFSSDAEYQAAVRSAPAQHALDLLNVGEYGSGSSKEQRLGLAPNQLNIAQVVKRFRGNQDVLRVLVSQNLVSPEEIKQILTGVVPPKP